MMQLITKVQVYDLYAVPTFIKALETKIGEWYQGGESGYLVCLVSAWAVEMGGSGGSSEVWVPLVA